MIRSILMMMMMILSTFALAISFSSVASADRDTHSGGEQVVIVRLNKLVHYENGMTLVLETPAPNLENCFHLENAASFSEADLKKIHTAVEKEKPIKLRVASGSVLEVL